MMQHDIMIKTTRTSYENKETNIGSTLQSNMQLCAQQKLFMTIHL